MSNVDDIQHSNGNVEPVKIEEYVHAAIKNPTFSDKETSNASANNDNKLSLNTNNLVSSPEITNLDQTIETDRFFKPSKIPVLRTKHLDTVNFNCNNDTLNKSMNSLVEECDMPKTLNVLNIPTSPITGKKYRSPLSSQDKTLNQLKKIANGNISNNNIPCDNTNDNKMENIVKNKTNTNDICHNSDSSITNCVDVENDAVSDKSTSLSASNKSLNNTTNLDNKVYKMSNETLTLERRPRFKWMFGPHKNANVVC